jgi:inorganic pyrophosphatase
VTASSPDGENRAVTTGDSPVNHPLDHLPAFNKDDEDLLTVIIETPRDSRNKFKYDPDAHCFSLSGVLPAGHSFPYDFGFVPSTTGDDGDPLDVLVLMDEPAFPGCLIPCRLIGVIEAEQTEEGQTNRNDRLIAVYANSRTHEGLRDLADLAPNLLKEIEHFFVSYNQARGKQFKPLARHGPARARKLVDKGTAAFARKRRQKSKAKKAK